MKRYGNIYEKVYTMENLKEAYKKARKGKSSYKEVQKIDRDPEKYLRDIQDMLKNKTFTTSKYKIFKKQDGGKERVIYKLPFYPDRIVQWAIMLQIEKIIINHIPQFSCASIPKRGIHKASEAVKRHIRHTPNAWYLQLDIKKFFPSIHHKHIKGILRQLFKDKDLLDILFNIIDSIEGGIGIPIGNYTSQYFANLTLVPFLNFIKHKLKIKSVVVYMDDIIIIGDSQEALQRWHKQISLFLWQKLNLKIKPKFKLKRITKSQGIDFVGYVHYATHTFLRKDIKTRMVAKMNKIKRRIRAGLISFSDYCSVFSYKGWLEKCDGGGLYFKYMKNITSIIRKECIIA